MQDLLNAYVARGFADFPGLSVWGTVPIKQELLNQLIAQFLTSAASPPARDASPTTASPALTPTLLRLVKKLEVKADAGVITIDFQIGV